MRVLRFSIVIGFSLLLTGCHLLKINTDEIFKLFWGQFAFNQEHNLFIGFAKVEEDYRCAEGIEHWHDDDHVCDWEADVTVRFMLIHNLKKEFVTVTLGQDPSQAIHYISEDGSLAIELTKVDVYPILRPKDSERHKFLQRNRFYRVSLILHSEAEMCDDRYLPVCSLIADNCGDDKLCLPEYQTFDNRCLSNKAGGNFAFAGECGGFEGLSPPIACTQEYLPVCALTPIVCITEPCNPIYETYSNDCSAKANHAQVVFPGECGGIEGESSPEPIEDVFCIAIFDPVCGIDGASIQRYSNSCFAEIGGALEIPESICELTGIPSL